MDLDINNYNLDDLLNLFKISAHFGESDLKRAKQIVLKTHPDKSGLPSEYFLFFYKLFSWCVHSNISCQATHMII